MLVILFFAIIIFIFTFLYLIYYLRLKNSKKKFKIGLFKNRLTRIYSFNNISDNILKDILDSIKDFHGSYEQVHAILPLLSDVKKHGDKLLLQRKFYHTILFPDIEKKLAYKIVRLQQAEIFVRSLSRKENDSLKNNMVSF